MGYRTDEEITISNIVDELPKKLDTIMVELVDLNDDYTKIVNSGIYGAEFIDKIEESLSCLFLVQQNIRKIKNNLK